MQLVVPAVAAAKLHPGRRPRRHPRQRGRSCARMTRDEVERSVLAVLTVDVLPLGLRGRGCIWRSHTC